MSENPASDHNQSVQGSAFQPPSVNGGSETAAAERRAFESKDLDSDGKEKEHGRHQRFQESANLVALVLLWVVAALTFAGMMIYVYHLAAPPCWRWLDDTSLDKIRTLLTGVLFSSAMSGYVNKRMSA